MLNFVSLFVGVRYKYFSFHLLLVWADHFERLMIKIHHQLQQFVIWDFQSHFHLLLNHSRFLKGAQRHLYFVFHSFLFQDLNVLFEPRCFEILHSQDYSLPTGVRLIDSFEQFLTASSLAYPAFISTHFQTSTHFVNYGFQLAVFQFWLGPFEDLIVIMPINLLADSFVHFDDQTLPN